MLRDVGVTETFRAVAHNASLQRIFEGSNDATRLDELAGQIIDHQATTGDELVDCLVAWYGHSLTGEAVDRFDTLDTDLAGMIGQAALVVSRTRSNRKPFTVDATYGVGIVSGDGLTCELKKGEAYIPTEGHVSIGGIEKARQVHRPLLVTRIYIGGHDDASGFLAYGTPDFAKRYTVDGRAEEAFEPADYTTPLDAAESCKPHVEVFLGTKAVRSFLENNEAVRQQVEALGAAKHLEDLLARAAA